MYKRNRNMVFGVLALVVALAAVSFAYAGFTSALNINGGAAVKASKWDIHFENLSNPAILEGSARVITAPTIQGSTTIGTYSVQLLSPGDSVTYTFDVVNDGNFDATLTTLTKGTPSCTTGFNCSNLTYTLKYSDGTTVSQNDTLNVGETKHMVLTLKFNNSNNSGVLATKDSTISNLGVTLLYSQLSNYTVPTSESSITFVSRANPNTVTVGDEITFGSEHFYVADEDDGKGNVVLLAKYNLETDNNGNQVALNNSKSDIIRLSNIKNYIAVPIENDDPNTLHFSNTNYWHNNGLISPYNANGASYDGNPYPYVYDSNSNLYNYVEDYVEELITNQGAPSTITGRLLSYEEAEALGCNAGSKNCSSAPSWVYNTSYWLGSAYPYSYLWGVLSGANFGRYDLNGGDGSLGLRPVIVVSSSEF